MLPSSPTCFKKTMDLRLGYARSKKISPRRLPNVAVPAPRSRSRTVATRDATVIDTETTLITVLATMLLWIVAHDDM